MQVYIEDIKEAAKRNDEDYLNMVISAYIMSFAIDTTVEQWKLDNYKILREASYPDVTEYLDAQVKINSGDEELVEEGQEQLKQYYADSLAVKKRFPKQQE